MNVLPVSLGYTFGGLAENDGVLRDEGEHIVLEYQSQEAILGVFKSGVRRARIPRDLLSSVTLRKSWFGLKTDLVVQSTTMEPVADVPGMTQGRLVLGVARRDRPAAERLVADLRLPGLPVAKPAQPDTDLP